MFDGVPSDQFHQFIASSRAALPLPLSFPLHGSSSPSPSPSPSFTSFDPYPSHQTLQLPHLLNAHQLHHQPSATTKDDQEDKEETSCLLSPNLEVQRERSISHLIHPWSNDEVLALLRIRSSMENWFSDFTWEHVSRKLAEYGYKRSAEKCKEKFEEESRHFNTNISYNKSYRFLSELEQLCHGDHHQNLHHQLPAGKSQNMETIAQKDNHQEQLDKMGQCPKLEGSKNETNPSKEEDDDAGDRVKHSKSKKRKRREKFEMLKCFCEDITYKMMAQQEELHNRLMEDMLRRDEENIAREEAWKRQEMDRIEKEIQVRAEEQAIAGQRQATIIEFLKKFTSIKVPNYNSNLPTSSSSLIQPPHHQNPNLSCHPSNNNNNKNHNNSQILQQNESEAEAEAATSSTHHVAVAHAHQSSPSIGCLTLPPTQNPNSPVPFAALPTTTFSPLVPKPNQNPNPSTHEREDIGKRWPRDEVLALINLRCNLCSSNSGGGGGGGVGEDKESGGGNKNSNGSNSTPLWERISQGMLELGYKRSAKRCKEKWENINKYFRKTKDGNKKRSMDSRTCPYFHQLSCLYSQGILVAPVAADSSASATQPENLPGPSPDDPINATTTTTAATY